MLLVLLCKDLLSVYVVICEVVGINDNSSPKWLMEDVVGAS